MFSNQPSYDQAQTGKRMTGFDVRKGEFSLAWDSGNGQLNDYQKRKQKNKDVQVKLNYQEPGNRQVGQRLPQGQDNGRVYQLESPFAQYVEPQQPQYQPPSRPNYDQEEVLGYLKKYEHIDQMPQEQLEKVMAYYESLKEPKSRQQIEPPQSQPRGNSSRRASNQTPMQPAERREPIRPKETAGGIIYGSQHSISDQKPPSRYSEAKSKNSVMIGDGYNYFKEEAHRKALAEQQNQLTSEQRNQVPAGYNQRGDYKRVNNIHFG